MRAGALLAVACAVYGGMRGTAGLTAVCLALVATALLTWGEMLAVAGGWALSYELGDPQHIGAYQGIYNSGYAAGLLLAPLVVAQTALRFVTVGWLYLGAVFLAAGALLLPATRWALSRRSPGGQSGWRDP